MEVTVPNSVMPKGIEYTGAASMSQYTTGRDANRIALAGSRIDSRHGERLARTCGDRAKFVAHPAPVCVHVKRRRSPSSSREKPTLAP
jgi:hypothetical protein